MQNYIIMTEMEYNHDGEVDYHELARQTGKFKPILDHFETSQQQKHIKWKTLPPKQLSLSTELIKYPSQTQSIWRFYLQQPMHMYKRQEIQDIVLNSFELLAKSQLIHEHGQVFLNINNCLIERVELNDSSFHLSMLDYKCLMVICRLNQAWKMSSLEYSLQSFYISNGVTYEAQKNKKGQFLIKQIYRYKKIYLILEQKQVKLKVEKQNKQIRVFQVNGHQLQNIAINWTNNSIIFKNISTQSVEYNISEEAVFDPLQATFKQQRIFQQMLRRINRAKYLSKKIQHQEIKEWHSFDDKICIQNKKQAKTTPQKMKNINSKHYEPHQKASNNSTNTFNNSESYSNKINKITMFSQPNKLKISQRIVTGPKQSNLTPSEMDYAVSVTDSKEKQIAYFDQFQNLLYEQQSITQENQLALNNSFEQFEKKEDCSKQKQILKELNKRRQKQQQQKRLLDELKNKLKQVMNEQKEWINKNFKLKLDIKRLKKTQNTTVDNKQIIEMRSKIAQLISCQQKLMLELNRIKKSESTQVIAFENQENSQNKNKDMIMCVVQSGNINQSIGFNSNQNKFKQPSNEEVNKVRKFIPSAVNTVNMAQNKNQNKGVTNESNKEEIAKANIGKLGSNLFSSIPLTEGTKPKINLMTSQQIKVKQKSSFVFGSDNPPRVVNNHREVNLNQGLSPRMASKPTQFFNNTPHNHQATQKPVRQNIQVNNAYPINPYSTFNSNNGTNTNFLHPNNYHHTTIIQHQNQINIQNQNNIYNNGSNNPSNYSSHQGELIIPNIAFSPADQNGGNSNKGKAMMFNPMN